MYGDCCNECVVFDVSELFGVFFVWWCVACLCGVYVFVVKDLCVLCLSL